MADGQLAPGGARVVDPVLSNVARGYRNPMAVWPALFPVVNVGQRGGRIIAFRAEDFLVYDTRRSPGADMERFDVGYSSDPYACVQRAIEGSVPVEIAEEAMAVPGIALGSLAAQRAMGIIDLQIENAAATLATADDSYASGHTATPNPKWDADNSTPQADVTDAKEHIRTGVGMEPNVLVVGPAVHDALISNADVIDRIKYTQAATAVAINDTLLAQYFGVDRYIVGRCRKGEPGSFEAVWGKFACLVYSNVTPLASMGSPSWAYTYRLSGYPIVEQPYYDDRARTWAYPTLTEDTPAVVGKDAGFLFKAVVS